MRGPGAVEGGDGGGPAGFVFLGVGDDVEGGFGADDAFLAGGSDEVVYEDGDL